jgi:hypothetical protein
MQKPATDRRLLILGVEIPKRSATMRKKHLRTAAKRRRKARHIPGRKKKK